MDTCYCYKCKEKTASTKVEKVKTINNKWRLKGVCKVCGTEKSTFIRAMKSLIEPSEAEELHKPVIKKFVKRRIVTLGIDDLWGADLVIMDKYVKENDGYKYMLNVIDTFSKYAWSEPLSRKSGKDVTKAFGIIIKRAISDGHKTPNLLHTDKGTEFENKEFKGLLAKHDIKMYHTENEEKSAIVERFNRTLNQKMKVQFEARQTFRWVGMLQGLLRDYNNRIHRTIGMKPVDVTDECEPLLLKKYNDNEQKPTSPKLKVGDRVRITVKKDTFSNKYRRNWTREIFVVVEVLNTLPVTYRIEALDGEEIVGSFYEKELQKTKINH